MCFQNVHVEMRKILNGVFKIYQIHPRIKILFKISTYSRPSAFSEFTTEMINNF